MPGLAARLAVQLQPPGQLAFCLQVRPQPGDRGPQHGKLGVLRLDHRTQPASQLTLLPGHAGRIGLTGHKTQACST